MADDVRPIDANALKQLTKSGDDFIFDPATEREILHMIDYQETIEAHPVKHVRWIFAGDGYFRCSECKQKAPSIMDEVILTDHCPHCGAKMY